MVYGVEGFGAVQSTIRRLPTRTGLLPSATGATVTATATATGEDCYRPGVPEHELEPPSPIT